MTFLGEREIWSSLRGTRFSPPGAAGHNERRRATYVSALQQAEELFGAARSVGPASSPLLLYYGLSQAGRAIAAAATQAQGDEWILSGHGIKARGLNGPLPDIKILAENGANARSSFGRLSLILGSPLWAPDEAPTLAQAWDLLPELVDKPLRDGIHRRPPLLATPNSAHDGHQLVSARVSGLPSWLARSDVTMSTFDAFMASYPTAKDYIVVVRQDGVPQYTTSFDGWVGVQMSWEAGPKYPVPEEVRDERLAGVLTEYRQGTCWLFPTLFPDRSPLHPMMAWWIVLYVLSMLARYQPAEWDAAIDINRSEYANSIEYLLEDARGVVPGVALSALGQVI